jgi:hypothetical protein
MQMEAGQDKSSNIKATLPNSRHWKPTWRKRSLTVRNASLSVNSSNRGPSQVQKTITFGLSQVK